MRRVVAVLGLVLLQALVGCVAPSRNTGSSQPTGDDSGLSTLMDGPQAVSTQSNPVPSSSQTIAILDDQPIAWGDLKLALVESSGGQVFAEMILDRKLEQRLAQQGQTVGLQQLETERMLLAATFDQENPDRAHRLLGQVRQRRGLGEHRFKQLLFRNAALRQLVQQQVEISDAAVEQAYQLEHGDRFELRLIVTESFVTAAALASRAQAGESFNLTGNLVKDVSIHTRAKRVTTGRYPI